MTATATAPVVREVRTNVILTDAELVLLDGRVSEKVQTAINVAKQRIAMVERFADLPPMLASLIADAVAEATREGRLIFRYENIRTCPTCGRNDGYWPHRRSSRTHRAGQPNYGAPIAFRAIELAYRVVGIKYHVALGCCEACFERVKPALLEALADVRAELPELLTGVKPAFRRMANYWCAKCEWTGHEGEMGRSTTLLGDGTYPSTCPKCGAGRGYFSQDMKRLETFTIVETAAGLVAA